MKTKKVWFVGVNGEVKRLTELEGKELSLRTMYPFIGNDCHTIEHVALKKGVDMWVDEEGLLKENFFNARASRYYREAYPHVDPEEIGIVGNAIITDNTKAGTFIEREIPAHPGVMIVGR